MLCLCLLWKQKIRLTSLIPTMVFGAFQNFLLALLSAKCYYCSRDLIVIVYGFVAIPGGPISQHQHDLSFRRQRCLLKLNWAFKVFSFSLSLFQRWWNAMQNLVRPSREIVLVLKIMTWLWLWGLVSFDWLMGVSPDLAFRLKPPQSNEKRNCQNNLV